jgi:hypothetical protein
MMRQSRLHRVFGADELQPAGGDLVVFQPTSADPWYDVAWRYVRPYQLLLYGTVMKPGEVMEAREGEVVKVSTIKSVPEMDGGKPWYPITLDEKSRGIQLKTGDFPYWPSMSRPPGTFVKVLPKQFRVLATEMQGTASDDTQRTYQAMLDSLTSILTPRIGNIVTDATKAKPLDEDEKDRARAAVARTLAKTVFSLWFERLYASRATPNLDTLAEQGIMLFSDDNTAPSTSRQDGAWDTLGQLRAFADSLTTEVGLPDFDKPDAEGGNGFSRALAKIAREPSSPDTLTGGTTPADLLTALAKTGTVALDPGLMASAAQRAAMLWTVKRSAPVASAPAPVTTPPAAPSIVPAPSAASREPETTAPPPQRGGMGTREAGAPSWLLPVAAGVVGLAIVSLLVRRD